MASINVVMTHAEIVYNPCIPVEKHVCWDRISRGQEVTERKAMTETIRNSRH